MVFKHKFTGFCIFASFWNQGKYCKMMQKHENLKKIDAKTQKQIPSLYEVDEPEVEQDHLHA